MEKRLTNDNVENDSDGRADQAAASRAQATGRDPLRILFVEDDGIIMLSSVGMLEDLGHAVTSAWSGEEALEILQSARRFDLLITDFSMPRMNGGQLAVAARQLFPDLPILLATGYAELPNDSGLDLPRVPKPYLPQHLEAGIASALKK